MIKEEKTTWIKNKTIFFSLNGQVVSDVEAPTANRKRPE